MRNISSFFIYFIANILKIQNFICLLFFKFKTKEVNIHDLISQNKFFFFYK